jgi:hypothetical protein
MEISPNSITNFIKEFETLAVRDFDEILIWLSLISTVASFKMHYLK